MVFWSKRWYQKDISKLTDLYLHVLFPNWFFEPIDSKGTKWYWLFIMDVSITLCQQFFIQHSRVTKRSFQEFCLTDYCWQKVPKNQIWDHFWKMIVAQNLCNFELETSKFGYLLIFLFPLPVQSFSKIGQQFVRVPPLNFWWITKSKNIKGAGILIKCLISMLSYLAETLQSERKSKNKQVAIIWSL